MRYKRTPWIYNNQDNMIRDCEGSYVAEVMTVNDYDGILMAAAPEMLKALEDVQKYISFKTHLDYERETSEKVGKAIAKAKGMAS
jgi:hypothetical protein